MKRRSLCVLAAGFVLAAGCRQDVVGEEPAAGPAAAVSPPPAGSAAPSAPPCRIVRVSVSSSGEEAGGQSMFPQVSADGRLVTFRSSATNLVPGDTGGFTDTFVHDCLTGSTERVSVDSSGGEANGHSTAGHISADGRLVAFASRATNLVPADTNGQSDVFLRDCRTGRTVRVNVKPSGGEADGYSTCGPISADGRFAVFTSKATNLTPVVANADMSTFLCDLGTGQIVNVSVSPSGQDADGQCVAAAISADGRYVAFASAASNLLPGGANALRDVFLRDTRTGRTVRASVGPSGRGGNGLSERPSISADGRFVTFSSKATNLVPGDTNGVQDVFMYDRDTARVARISVKPCGGEADGGSFGGTISADGRFVAFFSSATNLVSDDTNRLIDVFILDLRTGRTARVNVKPDGGEADGHSSYAAISADGRSVAFMSSSANLVPGDTNGKADVFITRNPHLIPRGP